MALDKLKMRKSVLHDQGAKLDDVLESAERGFYSAEGSKKSLIQVAGAIQNLAKEVDKDLEEGLIDGLDGSLKVAEYVKRWISRAAGCCEGAANQAEAAKLISQGRVEGLKKAVALVKADYDSTEAKLIDAENRLAMGVSEEDLLRPTLSAAEDIAARKKEALEAKTKKEEDSKSPKSAAEEPPKDAPKKRKPRKKAEPKKEE